MRKINEIILHCSATPEGKDFTVEQIRKWHLQRGFKDIGYHWVIYRDGSIHQGRKEEVNGAHCTNHNAHSIGICYIGGCDVHGEKAKDTRTEQLKLALIVLVDTMLEDYDLTLDDVHGHYEYCTYKKCPSFDIETFKEEYKQWKELTKLD